MLLLRIALTFGGTCLLAVGHVAAFNSKRLLAAVTLVRHGARTPLESEMRNRKKDLNTYPGAITTLGLLESENAGRYFGWRYKNIRNTQEVSAKNPSLQLAFFRSIGIGRALQSAEAFASGYFDGISTPLPQQQAANGTVVNANGLFPPIFSVSYKADNLLRGWKYCPKFTRSMKNLLSSEEFKQREQETQDFRLQIIAPKLKLSAEEASLANWHIVYDRIMNDYYDGLKMFSESQIAEAGKLASWVEIRRYGRTSHFDSNTSGGRLAYRTLKLFKDVAGGDQSQPRLHIYSAQYETILSLSNALDLDFPAEIPPFASALSIELYALEGPWRSESFIVSAEYHSRGEADVWHYQDSYSARKLRPRQLQCLAEGCLLDDFLNMQVFKDFPDDLSWCKACGEPIHEAGSILCGYVDPREESEFHPASYLEDPNGLEEDAFGEYWVPGAPRQDPTSFNMDDIWVFFLGWFVGTFLLCLATYSCLLWRGKVDMPFSWGSRLQKEGLLSPRASPSHRAALYHAASSGDEGAVFAPGLTIVGKQNTPRASESTYFENRCNGDA